MPLVWSDLANKSVTLYFHNVKSNPPANATPALKDSRSLERGLIVLETLAQRQAMSLSEIHRATGLPKSTLRRLLQTLVKRRFVRHSVADKLYRIAVTLPDFAVNPVPPGLAIFADVALKHSLNLTHTIAWPTDIHVLEPHCLQIIETTRTFSPFSLFKARIDLRVSLFGSASGTACLSQMPDDKVRALFEDKSISALLRPSRFALTWTGLQENLQKVREQGYGVRHDNYFNNDYALNDNLSAIAVPVRKEGELCGAITLLWPKSFLSIENFAERYLSDLKNTASKIEQDLASYTAKQKP